VLGTTVESTTKSTNVALFGSPASSLTNIPRLALDFFVVESFSVGGSLMYLSRSSEVETDDETTDLGTDTLWMIHPRVGFAYAIDETFSIWPRLGITYVSSTSESDNGDKTTTSGLELTGDVMFGISPFSHFAILVGPFLDLGLSGKTKFEPNAGDSQEADTTLTSFGLAVSIVGYY
jgi:hypothetical protein